MKIKNPDRKEKVRILVDKIKRGDSDEALTYFSYLTGLYGAYYAIAVLYKLEEEHQIAFIDSLRAKCDPGSLVDEEENETE